MELWLEGNPETRSSLRRDLLQHIVNGENEHFRKRSTSDRRSLEREGPALDNAGRTYCNAGADRARWTEMQEGGSSEEGSGHLHVTSFAFSTT